MMRMAELKFIAEAGESIVPVDKEVIIKRKGWDIVVLSEGKEINIGLKDLTVSGSKDWREGHAKIFWRGGRLYVKDLGSKNGTWKNGHLLRGWRRGSSGMNIPSDDIEIDEPCELRFGAETYCHVVLNHKMFIDPRSSFEISVKDLEELHKDPVVKSRIEVFSKDDKRALIGIRKGERRVVKGKDMEYIIASGYEREPRRILQGLELLLRRALDEESFDGAVKAVKFYIREHCGKIEEEIYRDIFLLNDEIDSYIKETDDVTKDQRRNELIRMISDMADGLKNYVWN